MMEGISREGAMMQRKKTWNQKVEIVQNSFLRCKQTPRFAREFYDNLFFLNPKIRDYFYATDFEHQEKALIHGLDFLFGFLDHDDEHARKQILRIAHSHSQGGLKIHPHHYYYWIEALIMTASKRDPQWHNNMIFYWREVVSMPVSFIISQYFKTDES